MTWAAQEARQRDDRVLQLRRDLPARPRPDLKTVDDIKAAVAVARGKIAAARGSLNEIEAEQAIANKTLDAANEALAALLAEADSGWPPAADALKAARQAVADAAMQVELLDRAQAARAGLLADERGEMFGLAKAYSWIVLYVERGEARQMRDKRVELQAEEEKRIDRTMAARADYEGIYTLRDAEYAVRRYGL